MQKVWGILQGIDVEKQLIYVSNDLRIEKDLSTKKITMFVKGASPSKVERALSLTGLSLSDLEVRNV
jgi:hypothetical protein